MIELVLEGYAVVDRLQESARCRCHPPHTGIARVDRKISDPAAHAGRADRTPVQTLEPFGIELEAWAFRGCRRRGRRPCARRRRLRCCSWLLERLDFLE